MRVKMRALLPVLAAIGLGGVAYAQPGAGDPGLSAALDAAQQAAERADCAGVLQALDPVVTGLEDGPERLVVQRMRLLCLGSEGRAQELPAVQKELARAMPRDGLVKAFGALIAANQDRFVDAADQIATLAATAPGALDVLSGAAVRAISMKLAEDHENEIRSRMMIALARADWEPADLPELRAGFAEGAISALIDQGETTEAVGLLERIDQPEQLSSMAVDRHLSPIWPAIEHLLGPGGATSVDNFAREKLALFAVSPYSELILRDAAHAMLLLGRYQDVLDMTEHVEIVDGISRDTVQTLLYRAQALAAMRRDDDADTLYAAFMKLDLDRSPSAVSAFVTYAEFLDEIGRSEAALTVTRAARTRSGQLLTDLGQRWLDRTEICSLSMLGRAAEADRAIREIKRKTGENYAPTIEALLCAKRDAEAATVAMEAFGDSESASELIHQFQPSGSLWASAPSRLRKLWAAFLTRPEIKAAFEKHGRILPHDLWPDPQPRAIPRRPLNGTTLI